MLIPMRTHQKYLAVLFDMDGVIVDTEPLHVLAFQTYLRAQGYELSDEEYKKFFAGKTDEAGFIEYFDAKGSDISVIDALREKSALYLELATSQIVPYPGVVDLICELSKTHKLALVTGSLRSEALLVLESLQIATCFDAVVAAEDITRSKPDPEGYQLAVRLLGVEASQCVVVEDSVSGVKAALAAGIESVAVTTTHEKMELTDATLTVGALDLSLF